MALRWITSGPHLIGRLFGPLKPQQGVRHRVEKLVRSKKIWETVSIPRVLTETSHLYSTPKQTTEFSFICLSIIASMYPGWCPGCVATNTLAGTCWSRGTLWESGVCCWARKGGTLKVKHFPFEAERVAQPYPWWYHSKQLLLTEFCATPKCKFLH